jgi:hypothetical protein
MPPSEVFKRAEKHYSNIEIAITCAIDNNHQTTANELLDEVLIRRDRDGILGSALKSAAHKNNTSIAERILKEDLSIQSFNIPLSIACSRSHTRIVALMVESLMREKKEDERFAAVMFEEEWQALRYIQTQRGRVLEGSLKLSIREKLYSAITMLLTPYLECAAYYESTTDCNNMCDVLQGMQGKYYTGIPRKLKLKFLSLKMPVEAKQSILRRLQWDSENETTLTDACLSTEGRTFKVHKDVLAYWSPYFSALFSGKWTDRDHVRFDGNISAATLEKVVDFMNSGSLVYQEAQLNQLEKLLSAADYLNIKSLKDQVETRLWVSRLR